MQDRPTSDELLAAVEGFLRDSVMQKAEGAQRYQARVAANVLGIVRRELAHGEGALDREWAGLDTLLGSAARPPAGAALLDAIAARSEELCGRIRRGDADDSPFRDGVLRHVRQTVLDKLLVTNPAWAGPDAGAGGSRG